MAAFGRTLGSSPTSMSEMLVAADFLLDVTKEIVIVTPSTDPAQAEPFLARLRTMFLPGRILAVVPEGDPLTALARVVPLASGKVARSGNATAYVCERGACKLPTSDPRVFAEQLAAPSVVLGTGQ